MTTMKMNAKMTALLALVLGTSALTASASDWGFSFGFGGRPTVAVVNAPRPRPIEVRREWVPDRYEKHDERVLVEPGHYVKQYVEPVYETRYDRHGHAQRIEIQRGYWTEVYVADRFETRCTEVLVPGFYREVTVGNFDRDHRDYRDYRDYRDNHDERDHHDDRRIETNDRDRRPNVGYANIAIRK